MERPVHGSFEDYGMTSVQRDLLLEESVDGAGAQLQGSRASMTP
jgi:hypothetical protein